jgi:hypothetical protein
MNYWRERSRKTSLERLKEQNFEKLFTKLKEVIFESSLFRPSFYLPNRKKKTKRERKKPKSLIFEGLYVGFFFHA